MQHVLDLLTPRVCILRAWRCSVVKVPDPGNILGERPPNNPQTEGDKHAGDLNTVLRDSLDDRIIQRDGGTGNLVCYNQAPSSIRGSSCRSVIRVYAAAPLLSLAC